MKSLLTKALLLLMIAGFAVACGGDPNIESAKLNLNRGDYQQVVSAAEAALVTNPESPIAFYYLGIGQSELGKQQPAAQREQFFRDARASFDRALELFEEQGRTGTERDFIPVQVTQIWGQEYNSAVQLIVPEEGEATEQGLQRSISHLRNAFAIEPDSVQSVDVLAEVHFMVGDLPNAIERMQQAIDLTQEPEAFRFVRLAFFQRENGDAEGSLATLNAGRAQFPGDIEISQEVANVYLQLGEIDQALLVVRELIQSDPENAQYRLVFGSQVYQLVLDMSDEQRDLYRSLDDMSRELRDAQRASRPDANVVSALRENIESTTQRIAELEEQIQDLTQQAEDELIVAAELAPDDDFVFNTLGVIYQNRAAAIYDLRNITEDIEEAARLDALAMDMLRQAVGFYERAAELDPDNQEYWLSLFRVYTRLGMTEEALNAQEKAGF
ncbi:MAG: tetratricopeptide repeat protein [Bacteroidetes bacterium]|nr:tetratricopeptide repeat protein [Bacteroidota bacterium]MCH8523348.1 tetratricopeptide repeat protein [Balneolales bacterium]